MTQLLDRLKQLEEEHKKIQAQLKAARRGKVKKDW
jgi:flagellar motility protein MotE (MotC chaperone)